MSFLKRICPLRRWRAARAVDPYRAALDLADRLRQQKRAYRRTLADLRRCVSPGREADR